MTMIKFLLKYIRLVVYLCALIIVVMVLIRARQELENQWILELLKNYAIIAIGFLYASLFASPLYAVFPKFPLRAVYIKARQALGVSAFFFGLAHGVLAYYISLGRFSGLIALRGIYLFAIILALIALIILTIMAITSLKYFIIKLGPRWKPLHRLVYIACIFILMHASLMGSNLMKKRIFLIALGILSLLEAIRFGKYIVQTTRHSSLPHKTNTTSLST